MQRLCACAFPPATPTCSGGAQHTHKRASCCPLQAWELFKQDPAQYWAIVPKRVQPALHFFNNNPVTVAGGAPNNPLNILRARWQPGDYVVRRRAGGGYGVGWDVIWWW